MQWRVLGVGPGRRTKKGILVPPEVAPGDCVLTGIYLGPKVALDDGTVVIDADEILAKWRPGETFPEE